MRWSAFIAGSIVGVAGAAVLATKRPGAFKSLAGAVSGAWNGMRGNRLELLVKSGLESFAIHEGISAGDSTNSSAKQEVPHQAARHEAKAADPKWDKPADSKPITTSHAATGGKSKDHKQAWNRIEQLVESDPHVKQETDKIMAENTSGRAH